MASLDISQPQHPESTSNLTPAIELEKTVLPQINTDKPASFVHPQEPENSPPTTTSDLKQSADAKDPATADILQEQPLDDESASVGEEEDIEDVDGYLEDLDKTAATL